MIITTLYIKTMPNRSNASTFSIHVIVASSLLRSTIDLYSVISRSGIVTNASIAVDDNDDQVMLMIMMIMIMMIVMIVIVIMMIMIR